MTEFVVSKNQTYPWELKNFYISFTTLGDGLDWNKSAGESETLFCSRKGYEELHGQSFQTYCKTFEVGPIQK